MASIDGPQGALSPDDGCRRGQIPPDLLPEEAIRRRSDTRQSREFQLQPDSRAPAGGRIVAIDELSRPEPHPPAARTVLEAEEALQRLTLGLLRVAQRVDLLGEHFPAVLEGKRRGELDLVVPLLHLCRNQD